MSRVALAERTARFLRRARNLRARNDELRLSLFATCNMLNTLRQVLAEEISPMPELEKFIAQHRAVLEDQR